MAINGPRHAKTGLRTYADSEGPGQPAHAHSLIRTFTVSLTESLDTIECMNGKQISR